MDKKTEVMLSVVIPVYNAERYIRKCLDSLVDQTLKEMEIICVNDGSSDGSLEILHEYARTDNRVIVINQENQGCNAARKNGYLRSSGRYLTLVDADDWLERDIYGIAVKRMEQEDADCAIFNWYIENGQHTEKCREIKSDFLFKEKEFIRRISLAGICGGCNPSVAGRLEGWPWNKVYRKRVFDSLYTRQKLFVDRTRHFDDAYTNMRLFKEVKSLLLLHQYGYHYRVGNPQSITGRYYGQLPPEKDFVHYQVFAAEVYPDFPENNMYKQALSTMMVNLFWDYVTKHHYFHKDNPDSFAKQLREIDHLLDGQYTGDRYFPIKEAMEGAEPDWICNRIMRFLVKKHMVSGLSLYIGSRISLFRQNRRQAGDKKRHVCKIKCNHSRL